MSRRITPGPRQPLQTAHILEYRRLCDFTNGPSDQMKQAVRNEAVGYINRLYEQYKLCGSFPKAIAKVQSLNGD